MRATLGLVLGATLAVFPARADWNVTARVGGTISAVAAEGRFVFIGVGARMHVFDVADPATPREVGSTKSFADNVSAIVLADSRAYVAAGTDGVHVVDLADVSNPRSIGHWDSPGSAEGLAVHGTLLAVADGPFGLQLVDVSDPASPAPISSVFETNFAFDVTIHGSHAFIAGADAGLLVANISVPSAPREVVILDTPGYARDVAVDGESLYLADQWGGVRIVSIAQPAVPHEVASVVLPGWAFAVEASGAALHVAAGSQGLHTLDVSDPSRPRTSGTYAIPLSHSWKVAVSNGRAFVGVRKEGVHIVDVSQPAALPRLGTIAPLVSAGPLAVQGDFAYVLTGDRGLRVFDLSDPERLRPRGSHDTTGERGGCIETVGARHVYVCGNPQFRAQLDVIDTGNVDQLAVVSSILASGGGAIELLHQGSLLYMPNEVGLEIFDVSNPAAPSSRGRIEFVPATTEASSIAVSGTTAFVNAGQQGLNAVDVSDPANMRIIGNLPATAGGTISEVSYRDGFVYGATGFPFPEFAVIDVRDPLRMVRVGSTPLPSAVTQDVLLDGAYAYVANGAGGVVVIDIRDPLRPVRVAQILIPGFAKGLALKDDRLLVTAGTGGLVEIRQTTTPAPALGTLAIAREPQMPGRNLPSRMPFNIAAAAASPPATTARSIVVTNTGDSGAGTLREALTNLAAGDVITFDPTAFPPHQPSTIRVATQLPHLKVGGVVIDASNAGVILDGSSLSGNFDSGIEIEPPSRGNTIRGMQIVNFPSAGIYIGGDGGNVIGGDRSLGAGPTGEGNVINRNRKFGIHVGNPNGNVIVGNFVGTDATGRVALGGQQFGVDLFYQPGGGTELGADRVGGSEPWEANVIAGNELAEVKLHNAGGHRVIGNFIGVDVDGNRIGDCSRGVLIDASSDNTVADNVIVAGHSVWIIDPGASCNQIVNNWIGMTKDGRVIPRQIDNEGGININESFNLVLGNRFGGVRYAAVLVIAQADAVVETIIAGNTFEGLSTTQPILGNAPVEVTAASRTFIGGSTAPFRNVIRAGRTGIRLYGGVDRTFVLGNAIGEDPHGLPNVNGIDTESSVHSFIQDNTIANSSGKGVIVGASRNRIRRNSIYGNQGGAISVDVSAGIPAPPHIGAVSLFTVSGTACPHCIIEIFSDPQAQARWYEGSTVTDAGGRFTFNFPRTSTGPDITATATDSAGSTSALSTPVARPPIPPRRRAARR